MVGERKGGEVFVCNTLLRAPEQAGILLARQRDVCTCMRMENSKNNKNYMYVVWLIISTQSVC